MAQNKFIDKRKSNKSQIEKVDSIKRVEDSLKRELVLINSELHDNIKRIDSIKSNAKQDSLRLISQRDSLLNVIRHKDSEIETLKENTGFVDTCIYRLANRWLYERFDKAYVDQAINFFGRINSSKLKEEFSMILELLRNYEVSYQEFQTIIKEAQSDIDRNSPFAYEQYRDKYKRKIENMKYYKTYYPKDWNIRYLNNQIDKAIQIIDNHKIGKFADFSTLIDKNL